MTGKLIVFEGIDGVGKNTLIDRLLEEIKNKENPLTPAWLKKEAFSTFEPTINSVPALKIKEHLESNEQKNNGLLLEWFIADRIEHTKKIKEKLLSSNVFCARYDLSTYAYQANEKTLLKDFATIYQKHQYALFDQLSFENSGSLIPDFTFFLKLDIATALERIEKRAEEKEYYEEKEKLIKIQNRYLEAILFLQKKDERKIFTINAGEPVARIVQLILEVLSQEA